MRLLRYPKGAHDAWAAKQAVCMCAERARARGAASSQNTLRSPISPKPIESEAVVLSFDGRSYS